MTPALPNAELDQTPRPALDGELPDLAAIRALTEQLALPLSPEDQTAQSMPDASPTKWHRAHTSWFFEEFVLDTRHSSAFDPGFATCSTATTTRSDRGTRDCSAGWSPGRGLP